MSTQIRGNKQIKNITIQNGQLADGNIELGKLREGSELIKRDGSVAFTGDLDLGTNQLKNVGEPVDANDAIRKADLDAATSGVLITREQPSGAINGTNTSFTLANTPNLGSEQVFLNGSLLNAGANSDYVIDGTTLTLTLAPQAGDVVLVNYITNGVVINVDVTTTLAQFNSRLTTSEAELFEAQTDISNLASDLSAVDGRLTTAEADIVALEGDVASLETSLAGVQSSVTSLQSDLSDEETARIAAFDDLDTRVSSMQTSVTSLGNRMNTAEGDIVALESADVAFDTRVGNVEDALQAETTARTNADNALSSRVSALEAVEPFSGSYTDLTDKPTLFSGSYNDLTNKPIIPSLTQVESDISSLDSRVTSVESNKVEVSTYNTKIAEIDAKNAAQDSRLTTVEADVALKANSADLASVATSGSYNDLTDKPSLFSGSYNDLSNKPAIPSPVREVPTGSVNGSNVTFTLSQTPSVANTEQVFLNGLLQFAGAEADYTISGGTITFNTAPDSGWKLVVYYFV